MSIEIGLTGNNVFVADEQMLDRGASGYSVEVLQEVLDEVRTSGTGFPGLEHALRETIDQAYLTRDIVHKRQAQNRFLYAAELGVGHQYPVGLLYAEGLRSSDDRRAFAAVTLGTWVSSTEAERIGFSEAEVAQTLEAFYLKPVTGDEKEDSFNELQGIIVDRDTFIGDTRSGNSETYGHRQDVRVLAGVLGLLPEELRPRLLAQVDSYHGERAFRGYNP